MKKILLLGGSAQQIVAIETAKRLGYYSVVCDYLVDNPGQYVADKFYLVSTTDKKAILEVAKNEKVDGVLAYASDPAAPTAAYVAEKLKLPTNPYKSVETLCNKDKFREFLSKNGFNCPKSKSYTNADLAKSEKESFNYPIIVKPVDSSGSKGVTILETPEKFEEAVDFAFSFSRAKRIIVEKFIVKKHKYTVGGDIFINNGEVVIWGLMNCFRDHSPNPLVPGGEIFPVLLSDTDIRAVKETLQDLTTKLNINSGCMNVELVIDKNNKVYLIDIGPRAGGNMIPIQLSAIFNVDIVELSIRAAMGEKLNITPKITIPYCAHYVLHSNKPGIFKGITFSKEIENNIFRKEIYKKPGDKIESFDNAAKALGIIFLKFSSQEEMYKKMESMDKYISVELENHTRPNKGKLAFSVSEITDRDAKEKVFTECDEAFSNSHLNNEALIKKIRDYAHVLEAKNTSTIGYCAFYLNQETKIAYLTLIAVKTKCQGKDVGKRLLEVFLEKAKTEGMIKAGLEVKKSNQNAINFYKKNGFLIAKEKNKETYLMVKTL